MNSEFFIAKSVKISIDEYGCQVLFIENTKGLDSNQYILFQFSEEEYEETPKGNYIYVESHREHLIGHYKRINAILMRGSLMIEIGKNQEIQIKFSISENKYKKLINVFEILCSGLGKFKYSR